MGRRIVNKDFNKVHDTFNVVELFATIWIIIVTALAVGIIGGVFYVLYCILHYFGVF